MATIKTKTAFLRELLALKEVIDTGQIQAAAERNGIKHSNMSKMISDLESRFKATLLIRSMQDSQSFWDVVGQYFAESNGAR